MEYCSTALKNVCMCIYLYVSLLYLGMCLPFYECCKRISLPGQVKCYYIVSNRSRQMTALVMRSSVRLVFTPPGRGLGCLKDIVQDT